MVPILFVSLPIVGHRQAFSTQLIKYVRGAENSGSLAHDGNRSRAGSLNFGQGQKVPPYPLPTP